jgi:hypothetical protein
MSGSTIPYHLRQNKAVERNLFVELLARVGRVRNISDYEYIGFGGPFMDDHKALHTALRMVQMHSIERKENTFRRQKFNYPAKFIKTHCKESGEFFRTHNFCEKGTVVWLDYTSAEDLNEQLNEFHGVVAKLDTYDVAKITLNASTTGLGPFPEIPETLKAAKRMGVLRDRIPNYVPADLAEKDLLTKNYPSTLQTCVQNSLHDLCARNTELYFHPLSSFSYADGQLMLTITGMVFKAHDDASAKKFIADSRLDHWPFANLTWAPPTPISMPALSAKERMKLDEFLPIDGSTLINPAEHLKHHLGFNPGANDEELANYAKYYRQYPHFSRVIL